MLVRGFPAQAFDTNCYVVAPGPGEQCVVVDPGIGVEQQLDDLLREHGLQPVAVLLTHGHLDHTFSVTPVCGARGIPAYISSQDRDQLADPVKYLSAGSSQLFGGRLEWSEPDDVRLLDPAEPLEIAGLRLNVDWAPGHTLGSVVFRLPGDELDGEAGAPVLLSGDVLFAGSIGRTDLPTGSWEDMQASLRDVVLPMTDETIVLPGHGPATTIGRERATNPFLQDLGGRGSKHSSALPGAVVGFAAPKGVPDYVPPRSEHLLAVREAMVAPLRLAGYGYLELPVFEDTALFARGVGETTDVVSKEMFTFVDRGERSLTLRPEGTVGAVRAALEAGLERGALPVKLWYAGPMFRYEQPQSGRQRQFTQVGAEALGSDDPALDAELVALADAAYRSMGLTQTELHLATLGDPEDRAGYSTRLREWLTPRVGGIDAETDRRIALNPLRVLDDKRPEVQKATADAPLLTDVLGPEATAHHEAVRRHLTDLGVPFVDDPRLVRGLDYYRRTTFEFIHPLLGAQSTIGAGGRYDGLSQAIDGPPLPGIGWALGVDRTLLALEAEGVLPDAPPRAQVFFVPLGADAKARSVALVGELRRAGIAADLAYGDRGMKGAMKAADRSGAAYAVVLGERDLEAGEAQLKELREHAQVAVPLDRLVQTLQELLT